MRRYDDSFPTVNNKDADGQAIGSLEPYFTLHLAREQERDWTDKSAASADKLE